MRNLTVLHFVSICTFKFTGSDFFDLLVKGKSSVMGERIGARHEKLPLGGLHRSSV